MNSVTSLYALSGQFEALYELACDTAEDDGRILPEFVAALNSLSGEIEYQMEGLCYTLKSVGSLREQLKQEATELQNRAARLAEKESQIKDCLQTMLERDGVTKRKAGRFTVRIQRNPPAVAILNLDAIPSRFDRILPREVSRTAILTALKAGEEVPGAEVVIGSHVRIA